MHTCTRGQILHGLIKLVRRLHAATLEWHLLYKVTEFEETVISHSLIKGKFMWVYKRDACQNSLNWRAARIYVILNKEKIKSKEK